MLLLKPRRRKKKIGWRENTEKKETREKGTQNEGRLKKKEENKLEQKGKKNKKKPSNLTGTRHLVSPTMGLGSLFSYLDVEEDNGLCLNCGMFFKDDQSEERSDNRFWVCCDMCDGWYCFIQVNCERHCSR